MVIGVISHYMLCYLILCSVFLGVVRLFMVFFWLLITIGVNDCCFLNFLTLPVAKTTLPALLSVNTELKGTVGVREDPMKIRRNYVEDLATCSREHI